EHDDRACASVFSVGREWDDVSVELAADGHAVDRQASPTAVVRLDEHADDEVLRVPRRRADAALESVADHSGAASDTALGDLGLGRGPERVEDVLRANVHPFDVVEAAVVRLADDRQVPATAVRAMLRRDESIAHHADRERVRDPDRRREQPRLTYP